MELVEEIRKPAKMVIGVLTGNGKREFKVLRAVAKKYDGTKKILYFPRLPGYRFGSGLSVLQIVKIYVSKYNIRSFLCLIDKEHFTQAEVEMEVKEKLRKFGVEVNQVQKFPVNSENTLCINGTVGNRSFILWIAITGKEKCIEENIAKLIEVKFGVKIEPTKNGVAEALKKRDVDEEQLITKTNKRNLKASFPALDFVLSHLESTTNSNTVY
ncbi:MAG: hypothetical protein QXI91_00395 [Candidatus Bathyarchaeia archaeon]